MTESATTICSNAGPAPADRQFFVGKTDARINYLVQQTFVVLLEARPRTTAGEP
jgi:hypothetical protein